MWFWLLSCWKMASQQWLNGVCTLETWLYWLHFSLIVSSSNLTKRCSTDLLCEDKVGEMRTKCYDYHKKQGIREVVQGEGIILPGTWRGFLGSSVERSSQFIYFAVFCSKRNWLIFFFFGLYLRENEKGKENKNQGKIMSRNCSGRQQKCSMVVCRHF